MNGDDDNDTDTVFGSLSIICFSRVDVGVFRSILNGKDASSCLMILGYSFLFSGTTIDTCCADKSLQGHKEIFGGGGKLDEL